MKNTESARTTGARSIGNLTASMMAFDENGSSVVVITLEAVAMTLLVIARAKREADVIENFMIVRGLVFDDKVWNSYHRDERIKPRITLHIYTLLLAAQHLYHTVTRLRCAPCQLFLFHE